MELQYEVVDVFTERPLEGNALAVFPDARGLSDELMQRIAREMNLSETTFVLPAALPEAAARVRIFTPWSEMVFAGHPTLGTAFVVRERGIVARDAAAFVLEEKVGPVKVRVDGAERSMIWLETPPIARGATFERALCAQALGLAEDALLENVPSQRLSAGNPAIFIALKNAAAVDAVKIDSAALRRLTASLNEPTCVFAFAPVPAGAYSRMFAEELGIAEDPATGSATGPLAAFMMEHGLAGTADGTRFVSEQGTKIGRRSLLHVLVHGENGRDGIEVGGHVTPLTTATMRLPDL
ncbi:MAG: PhzF family phenazine biosynthesis protein [Candidatus Eremiobacteraeota bacterium]|nr:PhzF family phenazine biosynthesis protein [Candidatus Eremiobacteraeota bacterium]